MQEFKRRRREAFDRQKIKEEREKEAKKVIERQEDSRKRGS